MTPSAWAFVRTVMMASLSERDERSTASSRLRYRASRAGHGRPPRRSSGGGGIHDQLGLHRQGADPATGCVEDGVGDGGGDADLPDLSHALGAERADQFVVH